MNPIAALHVHMKHTADGDELCGIQRKALSDCGIGISSLSKCKRDLTLHLTDPELVYSSCVSLLRGNDNKQPVPLGAVIVTHVSVFGFM